jgi:hypothetical protein
MSVENNLNSETEVTSMINCDVNQLSKKLTCLQFSLEANISSNRWRQRWARKLTKN